ncbi:hypothetical protein Q7P37_008986 [Cladosporium fusiforme]
MTHQDTTTDSSVDYLSINRARWDERAPHHALSPDYQIAQLLADPSFLSNTVTYDLPLLPSLQDKKICHLQCHIGTDTLSVARLGASSVTGLDFSPASLTEARELANQAAGGEKLHFVEGDVYSAPELLNKAAYDIVFTGIGSICWLPDIRRWARVVAELLKPGGELFIREGHPYLFTIDDGVTDRLVVSYPYFEQQEGLVTEEAGTYVRVGVELQPRKMVEWNHGIGEIVTALLEAGMRVTALVEHKSVPFNAFKGQMEEIGGGEWALKEGRDPDSSSGALKSAHGCRASEIQLQPVTTSNQSSFHHCHR